MTCHAVSVDPEQEHCTFSSRTISGMKSTSSSLSKEQDTSTELQHCRERINFIIHQIESLEHYLPETYQMLMEELDQQHLKLKHLEIRDFYYRQNNAEQDKTTDSRNQKQGQEPIDCTT
jgi:hypothetical protein